MRAPAGAAGSCGCAPAARSRRAGRARCDRRVAQRVDVDAAPVEGVPVGHAACGPPAVRAAASMGRMEWEQSGAEHLKGVPLPGQGEEGGGGGGTGWD